MKPNALRKQLEVAETKEAQAQKCNTPYRVSDMNGTNPIHHLAELVCLWAPRDLRYNRYDNSDSALLNDIASGMETSLTQKDLINNMVEITVEFQENLSEYERYNIVAHDHNTKWIQSGAHTSTFNAVTGDITPVKDTFIDPVLPDSSHNPIVDEVYRNQSSGPLAKARPSMRRKGYIRVRYQLQVNQSSKLFTLSYVAYDKNNAVIYYNETVGIDLSKLIRRSVQEIWGNPTIQGYNKGPYLEGIPMLINGKKLPYCHAHNRRPVFMDQSQVCKDSNKQLILEEVSETGLEIGQLILGIISPLVIIVTMLVVSVRSMVSGITYGNSSALGHWFIWMTLLLIGLFVSRHLSQQFSRKSSQINAHKKFI